MNQKVQNDKLLYFDRVVQSSVRVYTHTHNTLKTVWQSSKCVWFLFFSVDRGRFTLAFVFSCNGSVERICLYSCHNTAKRRPQLCNIHIIHFSIAALTLAWSSRACHPTNFVVMHLLLTFGFFLFLVLCFYSKEFSGERDRGGENVLWVFVVVRLFGLFLYF